MLYRSRVVFAGLAMVGAAVAILAQAPTQTDVAARSARIAAAQRFLASLDTSQRSRASYAFDDPIKARWNNLPPTMAARGGIVFRDLTPEQQRLGIDLLRTVLSSYGYDKVQAIMAADDRFGQLRGPDGFPTGPMAYMLAVFGTPSATQPWAVQFNGHHLGVNVTVTSPGNVLTPTLTAAYPNIYERDGREVFVLGDEATRALRLTQSLTPAQREKAVQKSQIWDFVLGPGHDNETLQPEGLRGSDMTPAQRDMLADVAAAWVAIVDDASARAKMDEIRRNLADTFWLWSGDMTRPGHAYFRLHGPTVWIEYSPQTAGGPGSLASFAGGARGGGRGPGATPAGAGAGRGRGPVADDPNRQLDATHVHTVFRDFTSDYARKFIAAVR